MEITKIFEFDAAHRLPDYNGKCANLHGHRWKLEVTIEGEVDKKTGMIMDFGELKTIVNETILNHLDHNYLNDLEGLKNPTAENIIREIWNGLSYHIKKPLKIAELKLWETPTNCITLRK